MLLNKYNIDTSSICLAFLKTYYVSRACHVGGIISVNIALSSAWWNICCRYNIEHINIWRKSWSGALTATLTIRLRKNQSPERTLSSADIISSEKRKVMIFNAFRLEWRGGGHYASAVAETWYEIGSSAWVRKFSPAAATPRRRLNR